MASEQDGYYTAEQAAARGYARDMLTYHTRTGAFRRLYRGVYRFRDYPSPPREQVFAGWLAVGKDSAVVSHESALDLWDLSDVVPSSVHLTAPPVVPQPCKALIAVRGHSHTSRPLFGDEVRRQQGIRVTSPERTVLFAQDGTQPEQIERAIGHAVRRGWIDSERLRRRAGERGKRVAELIDDALTGAEADGQT